MEAPTPLFGGPPLPRSPSLPFNRPPRPHRGHTEANASNRSASPHQPPFLPLRTPLSPPSASSSFHPSPPLWRIAHARELHVNTHARAARQAAPILLAIFGTLACTIITVHAHCPSGYTLQDALGCICKCCNAGVNASPIRRLDRPYEFVDCLWMWRCTSARPRAPPGLRHSSGRQGQYAQTWTTVIAFFSSTHAWSQQMAVAAASSSQLD